MGLGYDRPLFVLALDHRVPPHNGVFGVDRVQTPAGTTRIIDAKSVIVEGFAHAVQAGAPPDASGILVDEELGATAARRAVADGWIFAMPAERSGLPWFELEHGDDFAHHIEAFDPTFVKVLVRYNAAGNLAHNARSIEGLRRLSAWLRPHDRRFLCELIVVATPAQLDAVGGDRDRFEAELRPALMRRGIAELQQAGIEPDVWKIEGIPRQEDCEMVAGAARANGRDRVGCVVLGGADPAKVDDWLRAAAGVPGYLGFAIGRTLWAEPIQGYLAGSLSRADAAAQISARYRHAIDVYQGATVSGGG